MRRWIPAAPSEQEMTRRYQDYFDIPEGWYPANTDIPEPLTLAPVALTVDADWPRWESKPWDWSVGDPPEAYRRNPAQSAEIASGGEAQGPVTYRLFDVGEVYSEPVSLEAGSLITAENLRMSSQWAPPGAAGVAIVTAVNPDSPISVEVAYCGAGNHEWAGTIAYRTAEGLRVRLGHYIDGDLVGVTGEAGRIRVCG